MNLNRKTIVRKLLFQAAQARVLFTSANSKKPKAQIIEIDDLETFEHTKCKPLSVLVALETGTRRIFDFEVARMPAKGKLAAISRKKYGRRKDERSRARKALFLRLQPLIESKGIIKSDQSPHYPADLFDFFPDCRHQLHKGRRGCVTGQGELKKGGFDPLFSINHTFAKLRADINRLFRRTWCTTKKPERLAAHLSMYVHFHNEQLKRNERQA